jgi:catechol 2,3-dioxygenase-like lactoylglutathione lyase family enzyme
MIVDADDDDLAGQLRVLEQMHRHRHAALFVGDVLGRPGEEVALQTPRRLAERIQRGESRLDESSPIRTTIGEDALLEAARENDPVTEGLAELCGESEAILLIDEVLEGADEQVGLVHWPPLCPTFFHLSTPRNHRLPARCHHPRVSVEDWDWSRRIFDHVDVHASRYGESVRFYETVLEPLGIPKLMVGDGWTAFPNFDVADRRPPTKNLHICFYARSRANVEAFHRAGVEAGFRSNGGPGYRDYGAGYYSAYLLDPDGNNVEALFRDVGNIGHLASPTLT